MNFIALKGPRGDHWLNLDLVSMVRESLVGIGDGCVYVYFTGGIGAAAVEYPIDDAAPLLAALKEGIGMTNTMHEYPPEHCEQCGVTPETDYPAPVVLVDHFGATLCRQCVKTKEQQR